MRTLCDASHEEFESHERSIDTIRYDNFIYTRYFHQLIKLIIYSSGLQADMSDVRIIYQVCDMQFGIEY